MDCPDIWEKYDNSSVFQLITRLCEKTIEIHEPSEDFIPVNKALLKKLRSQAYAVLLKKSTLHPFKICDPVMDMLGDYFVKDCNKKNLGDYDNLVSLKSKIDWLVDRDKSKDTPHFTDSLACVVSMRNSVPVNHGKSLFENPFSFGKIDEILPTPEQLDKNDPKPYQYFPPHIFQLPFPINEDEYFRTNSTYLYNLPMEAFTSKPGTNLAFLGKKNFTTGHSTASRSSIGNLWSGTVSLASLNEDGFLSCPRLTGPRDLEIPKVDYEVQKKKKTFKSKESLFLSEAPECEIDDILHKPSYTDIWDLASTAIEVDLDLWEEAAKMPVVEKRAFISSSMMQLTNWKLTHMHQLKRLHIITEVQFILHVKYLTMGIESSSFTFNKSVEKFQMKENLCLEGLLQCSLETYVSDLLTIGTCYWKLNHLVTPVSTGKEIIKDGFVYKSMCDSIRQYLVWFRLEVDKIFGEGLTAGGMRDGKRLPTLMEILHQFKPLGCQIQTMAKIYKVYEHEYNENTLRGAELMAYLYNEISLVSQPDISAILYATLKATCCVYFRFIQRFIFEGELEDHFNEFFIRKDFMNIDTHSKRYWDKGFIIRNNETVPEFLRGMARDILLCGKSLRLLKLCNPDDPLCVLLSTEYPPIKCCLSFPEIEEQQKLYERYRMQCLYVCGDPVTFQSILLQREADKNAFREMVSLKQAETMEKLIEERKRLVHILSANKRRQLSALRCAAEDAVARKAALRQQDLQQERLLLQHQEARNQLHQLRVKEEKEKVNAYYTEIGKEVERRQLRAEWKIKRLRLDERRVQLLTSEKMNLKREKLELEHKVIEQTETDAAKQIVTSDAMGTNTTSTDLPENSPDEGFSTEINETESQNSNGNGKGDNVIRHVSSDNIPKSQDVKQKIIKIKSADDVSDVFINTNNNETSDDSKTEINSDVSKESNDIIEGQQQLQISDVINKNTLLNLKVHKSLDFDISPSDILNSNVAPNVKMVSFSDQNIFEKYQQQKQEALRNKQKVMAHEFAMHRTDQKTDEVITPDDNQNTQLVTNVSDVFLEAQRNRDKVLGSVVFDQNTFEDINRNEMPQYNTAASREALQNKKKILGHEFGMQVDKTSKESRLKQRGSLTLDLKGCSKSFQIKKPEENIQSNPMSIDSTPDHFLATPSEFQGRLDIETPSALDFGIFGISSANTLTPCTSHADSAMSNVVPFTNDGFRFPNIIEQQSDEEETVPDYPHKDQYLQTPEIERIFNDSAKSSVWNFSSDDLNFDNFKPFGIERTDGETFENMGIFEKRLCMENPKSPYTNFEDILTQVQKKPMTDIFKSICSVDEDSNVIQNIENVDPSMMSACLQRSIMIPLSYQMEMVNNATLKYFLIDCELYDHLKSLCDYFFLMDGEFAKTICSKLFEKLSTTESPRELLNFATLHSILDKSFGSSIGGSNKYAENLSFIITDMPLSFHHSSPDVLESLTLSYSVAWPTNIILSHEALERYARVFQFLVKMRRISWVLEQDLEVLKMSLKEEFMVAHELLHSPQYHSVQLYRYTMSCLIRALHGYVVNTCIKSSWTEFEKDLMQVRTLDDLYAVHVVYIKKVLFRCLLNKRSTPIMKLLNDIFTVVLRFHHLLNARCWHIAENEVFYTHPFFPQMKELYLTFDKLAKHLHKTASRLSECGYQPHLIELVTLVNMNGYYSGENL